MTPQDWRCFGLFLVYGAGGMVAAFYGPTWLAATAFFFSGFYFGEIRV